MYIIKIVHNKCTFYFYLNVFAKSFLQFLSPALSFKAADYLHQTSAAFICKFTDCSDPHPSYLLIQTLSLHISTRMYCTPPCSPLLSLTVLQFRSLISDFAIIISILVFCGLDCLMDLDTPKLHVPTKIKVDSSLNTSSLFPKLFYITAWMHFFPT